MGEANLPGFTADVTLSTIRQRYRAAGRRSGRIGVLVVPQMLSVVGLQGNGASNAIGPVYFQCGWNPAAGKGQCACSGNADCNKMFTSGFCGGNASCDTGAGSCSCDLML